MRDGRGELILLSYRSDEDGSIHAPGDAYA